MQPSGEMPPTQQKKSLGLGVDGLILGLGALLLIGAVFFLFQDGLLSSGVSGDKKLTPVGRFVSSQNDVRRRVEAGLSWGPAKTSDTVYEGDSIFTGDNSQAAVELDKGGQLSIDAKSLVVVRTQGSQLEVDLQYGSLLGKVAQNAPIILNQGGVKQELTAQNAEVRIVRSAKSKETRIQVVKGEVVMREKRSGPLGLGGKLPGFGKSEKRVVRQNEFIALKENAKTVVKKIPVTLLAPATGKTVWVPEGQAVRFQWKVDPSAASASYSIEFSRDTSFDAPLFKAPVQGATFDLAEAQRPKGSFYWRITPNANDPGLLASLPWRLTSYADVPPVLTAPVDDTLVQLQPGETKRALELSWEDKRGGATEFELQIARDEDFQDIVIDKKTKGRSERTQPLAAGSYFWRVMGLHPERPNAPWSQALSFELKETPKDPDAPVLASNQIDYEIPKETLRRLPASVPASDRGIAAENITAFSWNSVENAVEYEVEMASNESFENPVQKTVKETQFAPSEVRPGAYYVRVKAKGASGHLSPPSAPGRLNVFLPPPHVLPIQAETKKYETAEELESGTHEFKVRWSPQPFAAGYELEWGADPEFTQSKKFRVKQAGRAIPVSKPMDYLARVRSLDTAGNPLSPFSEAQVASFKKELLPPPKPSPTPVELKPAAAPMPASEASANPLEQAANAPTPMDPMAAKAEAPLTPEAAAQAAQERKLAAEKAERLAGLNPLIRSPSLHYPRKQSVFVSLENSPSFVSFRWSPVSGAKFYTIQISQDPDFADVIGEIQANRSSFLYQKTLPEGQVYWRVRAHKGGKFSEWSKPFEMKVMHN